MATENKRADCPVFPFDRLACRTNHLQTCAVGADRDRRFAEAVREAFNHAVKLTEEIEAAHVKHYERSIYHGSSPEFCREFGNGTPCTASAGNVSAKEEDHS